MLLGGSGKTTLVKEMLAASALASDNNIIPCYVDCSSAARLPSACIWDVLPVSVRLSWLRYKIKFPAEDSITLLDRMIKASGRVVFLVMDEFQCVYEPSCAIGLDITGEMNVIGGLEGCAIHCIITGDSPLERLAFCRLDDKGEKYPGYGIDLNITKFSPEWIN